MAIAKYTPFGDTLNPGVAIIQAANALDIAAQFAVSSRDSETLVRIAREWVEMSGHLAYDDEESDGPGDEEGSRSFGFSTVSDTNEGEENAECEC